MCLEFCHFLVVVAAIDSFRVCYCSPLCKLIDAFKSFVVLVIHTFSLNLFLIFLSVRLTRFLKVSNIERKERERSEQNFCAHQYGFPIMNDFHGFFPSLKLFSL